MIINEININNFKQDFNVPLERKSKYGEVITDFNLINKMLDLIPSKYYKNPNLIWLDPCCGSGYFMICLYKRLYKSLQTIIPEPNIRTIHIITKMIYMVEVNSDHIPLLKSIFGEKSNIISQDFLTYNNITPNIIIGNPPYNINGLIKVPTNRSINKKEDGKMIWTKFITHSIDIMKSNGLLCFITPSIWMKNDHKMFNYMLQYTVKKIHTFTNTETKKIFHGQAQTPTCYFLLRKLKRHKHPMIRPISIYDNSLQKYVDFNYNYCSYHSSLPLQGISILNKLKEEVICYGRIDVRKTNMRPGYKNLSTNKFQTDQYPYPNISTCKLNKNQPVLDINYSNIECSYANKPKLVLAHKMYGFPYFDISGVYGISNRDNYVIIDKTYEQFVKLQQFLSSKLVIFLFEATRYRMKYLEKYIFEMLPDITRIKCFMINDITDNLIFNYFKLDEVERNIIMIFHKKQYLNTILPN